MVRGILGTFQGIWTLTHRFTVAIYYRDVSNSLFNIFKTVQSYTFFILKETKQILEVS